MRATGYVIVPLLFLLSALHANGNRGQPIFLNRNAGAGLSTPRGGSAVAINRNPLNTFVDTILEARRHLAAAAVARCVSIFGMYPIDTIKTRVQLGQPLQQAANVQGLYQGVGGSLLGQVPYGVLTFGSYELYKPALRERLPDWVPNGVVYALSAVLGDVTGSFWLCPSEVVKQQLQAGLHKSSRDAVSNILKSQGVRGLYQGYLGGLARDVPFRVAQLTTYELTKNFYLRIKKARQHLSKDDNLDKLNELSPIEAATCGAVAGTISAALTTPLDRIKTILMTDGAAYGGTVASCASKILQEEGLMGFSTGLGPRVIYIAPSVAVFFVSYEFVQQRLKDWK